MAWWQRFGSEPMDSASFELQTSLQEQTDIHPIIGHGQAASTEAGQL